MPLFRASFFISGPTRALRHLAALGIGVFAVPAIGQVRINEFLAASNKDSEFTDADGDAPDWIEFYNAGAESVELSGYYLTDDAEAQRKWALPSHSLAANQYLVVFASGKDRTDPAAEWHTDFQLSRSEGSYLALTRDGAGDTVEIVTVYDQYPQQRDAVSFGIASVQPLVSLGYFSIPTPGAANDSGETIEGYVADTKFSVDRGFFTESFSVEITSATPGATLIYTTDGSFPSAANGTTVAAADGATAPMATVQVPTTTILRAIAVKDGWAPTNVDSQSYIFAADVLLQDGADLGGRRWGHAGADWEMDPDVVNHEDPESRVVVDDLLALPTVSVSLPFDDFFGSRGIYISGEGVERECGIEYFNSNGDAAAPNDGDTVQVDGTIQIVGGSSTGRWKSDNLSMRLKFGADLDYPMFGDDGADSFDTLVLDARLNHAWHYGGGSDPVNQRGRAMYFRDQMAADIQRELGGYSPRGKHIHFYINGIYWGIRMLHERPDDNFAASYMGGDNSEYAAMKHRSGTEVAPGSRRPYSDFLKLVRKDMTDPMEFGAVAAVLDLEQHINYMLTNFYIGNTDWAHQNWYASFGKDRPGGKWRYHSWDAEHTFKSPTENVINKNDSGGPTEVHTRLMKNPGYALLFADMVHKHFFNGGTFTPDRIIELFHRRLDPVDLAIRAQSARWGDNQRASRPYTRGVEYLAEKERLLTEYFPTRADSVFSRIARKRNWYPSVDAPVLSQFGGHVAVGYDLEMETSDGAAIYFTLDGGDPRMSGAPPEDVELVPDVYPKKVLVPTEDIGMAWRATTTADGFDDGAWASGNLGAGFERTSGTGFEAFIDEGLILRDQLWGVNATFYMRVEFQLDTLPGPTDALKLLARYDDGFIAYLNGTEVARANAEDADWNSSATGSHSEPEAEQFVEFDISAQRDQLKVGANLLAIQAMNASAGGSDMLFQPKLIIGAAGGGGGVVSPLATLYTGPVALQSSGEVSARALTTEGEWSALTQATFLVDTEPASAANLVVSEIHYRPAAPTAEELAIGYNGRTDFEFLELRNIGSRTIELAGLQVIDGVAFDFADAAIQLLAPGEHVLLVENAGAFALRYGATAASRVAGVFAGGSQLSNGGEDIVIINPLLPDGEQTVKSFTYDDVSPWPTAADGDGFSLVLKSPGENPDHGLASSWMASGVTGGSPGAADGEPIAGFDAWLASYGLDGADPASDDDHDGQSVLLEYGGGTSPLDGGSSLVLAIERTDAGEAIASYLRPTGGAAGVDYVLQRAVALDDWGDVPSAPSTEPVTGAIERVGVVLPTVGREMYIRLLIRMR